MSWWKNLQTFWHRLTGSACAEVGKFPDPNKTADLPELPGSLVMQTGASRLRVGVHSVVGNYREHNEDNYYVPGLGTLTSPAPAAQGQSWLAKSTDNGQRELESDSTGNGPEGLFLVADGMGGQLAGEQASRIAVELIPRELRPRLGAEDDDRAIQAAVRQSVAAANREIIAQSHVMPEYSNMGTTIVLALFRRGRVYVAGIGDSRVYRLRDGQLEKLTRDHDLATALIDAGTIRADEAEHHRFRNVLYLYLGSPDAREGPEDIRVLDVHPGDKFLLASDGLTGVVKDQTIAEFLKRYDDPQESARALVAHALACDSRDNVTCVVIHAE